MSFVRRSKNKIADMLQPKVVTQNIVAHVTTPKDRVWIISAPDEEGILCLNTISTTLLRESTVTIYALSLILNSSLASWFYYEFVFCRAIRTMHFDHYYAGKLPIPHLNEDERTEAESVARLAGRTEARARRLRMIDECVFDLYRLSRSEREFVHRYCYGEPGVPDSLDRD